MSESVRSVAQEQRMKIELSIISPIVLLNLGHFSTSESNNRSNRSADQPNQKPRERARAFFSIGAQA